MSIGTTIKQLRRARDMTQEQLAEHLGITANAISQWECDRTAPDISQLPLLAYILDVTTDEILGVDSRKYEQEIRRILGEQEPHYAAGDFGRCAEILRGGLARYPKSYRLMARLAHCLGCLGGHDEEVISLCGKVIAECTDNEIRDCAYQDLIFCHKNGGRIQEAIAAAKKMSHTWVSQEDMLMLLLKGEDEGKHLVSYIKFCSGRLMMCLEQLAEQPAYTTAEKIALLGQCAALLELLYPDGDFHYYAQFAATACYAMAKLCAESGDAEGALQALEQTARYSVCFDTYAEDAVNTSPAVRGYCDGGWIPTPDGSYCAQKQRGIVEEEAFDLLRTEPRYLAVLEELAKHAK